MSFMMHVCNGHGGDVVAVAMAKTSGLILVYES
jgi:hypothetical protein